MIRICLINLRSALNILVRGGKHTQKMISLWAQNRLLTLNQRRF